MRTVPNRHHDWRQLALAVAATTAMVALFLAFERTFLWLAAILALVTLLPVLPNDWSPREVYWRAFIAGVLVAVGIAIWLT